MRPSVSAIITTKNEEKHIENCLKSIRNQTYKDIEIIVVDNDSNDKTKEIAGRYTKQVCPLIKHHEGKLNLWFSMRKKYYYAQTVGKYIKKHPDMARKQFTLLRPAFRKKLEKMSVADVKLFEQVSGKEKLYLMRRAHVILVPGVREGWV